MKDLWYNTIERVSVSGGNEVNDQARLVGISDDGKSITFSTSASSIDPFGDNGSDIFIAKNGVFNLFNRPEDGILTIDGFAEDLTYLLDENDNVKIIDSNGYELVLKGIVALQFNDQEISVQDIRDSLVANGEYQPPSLFDSAVLGSGSDKFYGSDRDDFVKTSGGADYIALGAGSDVALIEGAVLKTDRNPYLTTANYVLVDTGLGDDIVEISTDFEGQVRLLSGGGLDTLVINGDVGAFSWSAGTGANRDDIILTSADASIVLADQMAYDEHLVFSYIEFVTTDPVTGQETSEIFQIDPNAPQVEGAIVTLLGTDRNDELEVRWDLGPVSIAGLKGDDYIGGGVSDDKLDGGEGDDWLSGGSGEDTLSGGVGEDFLEGGAGSDRLFGGLGDDVYKIDLSYSGFLDRAGYDDPDQNRDDIVVGNVDKIVDDGGADRVWITNFQPTLNPFDQYKDMLSVDADGSLVMKWGWDAESPSSYQYTLRDGYEYEIYDPVVTAAVSNGGYVVTKSNVNSASQEPTYTWPVFAYEWQAENFYREQAGLNWDAPATVHQIRIAPRTIAKENETGYALDSATSVQWVEFWVPGPEGSVNEHKGYGPDFTAYPDMVNIADTLFYRSSNKEYEQGGNLRALEKSGENTHFDLGRIETWPGFDKLPEAIDPANPEAGTQEYYLQRFELGKSDTYPSADEMPFIKVMTGYTHPEGYQIPGYLVSMESQAAGCG